MLERDAAQQLVLDVIGVLAVLCGVGKRAEARQPRHAVLGGEARVVQFVVSDGGDDEFIGTGQLVHEIGGVFALTRPVLIENVEFESSVGAHFFELVWRDLHNAAMLRPTSDTLIGQTSASVFCVAFTVCSE
jgi:hypothetical protein